MGVRELGNGLGNPLGRARSAAGGGAAGGSVVSKSIVNETKIGMLVYESINSGVCYGVDVRNSPPLGPAPVALATVAPYQTGSLTYDFQSNGYAVAYASCPVTGRNVVVVPLENEYRFFVYDKQNALVGNDTIPCATCRGVGVDFYPDGSFLIVGKPSAAAAAAARKYNADGSLHGTFSMEIPAGHRLGSMVSARNQIRINPSNGDILCITRDGDGYGTLRVFSPGGTLKTTLSMPGIFNNSFDMSSTLLAVTGTNGYTSNNVGIITFSLSSYAQIGSVAWTVGSPYAESMAVSVRKTDNRVVAVWTRSASGSQSINLVAYTANLSSMVWSTSVNPGDDGSYSQVASVSHRGQSGDFVVSFVKRTGSNNGYQSAIVYGPNAFDTGVVVKTPVWIVHPTEVYVGQFADWNNLTHELVFISSSFQLPSYTPYKYHYRIYEDGEYVFKGIVVAAGSVNNVMQSGQYIGALDYGQFYCDFRASGGSSYTALGGNYVLWR